MEELRVKAREGGGSKVLEKWKSKGKGKKKEIEEVDPDSKIIRTE